MFVSPLTGNRGFLFTFSLTASLLISFLLIPLGVLLVTAGLSGVMDVAMNREAITSILLSFEAGSLAATVSVLLGVPLAYLLSRVKFRGKGVVEGLLDLPLVIPHTVAGIVVLLAYSSRTPVGSVLSNFGLVVEDSFWGIVAAMLFVSAPFSVNFARQGFNAVDGGLEQVARSLGAGPFRVFFTVSFPLAARSILVGWLMALARAISEVGAIMIIAYHPIVGSVLVYEWFTTRGLKAAASLSVLLLAVSLLVLIGFRVVQKTGRKEVGVFQR